MKRLLTIGTLFFSFFAYAHSNALGSEDKAAESDAKAAIIAEPASYNFGDIFPEKGVISTTFIIKNIGNQTLKLNRLSTSCGCTKAEMDMADLPAGEQRVMNVTFDPSVHPDESGELTRVVYLQTSDPVLPELEIEISGNIIRKKSEETNNNGNGKNINNPEGKNDPTNRNEEKIAIVFFNEACEDCGELVKQHYPALFSKYNYRLEQKDYINERANRKLLNEYNEKWGVPFELQSHIEAFIGEKLLIGGHVPEEIIRYLMENPEQYDKLLVYQDKMHGEGTDYKVWDFKGDIKTYALDEPITNYLNEASDTNTETKLPVAKTFWGLFALITGSAFLDGINPCAIAVLLFFIAFLFSIKQSKRSIWKMGMTYIAAIYLAYFLIGIGIAQAIVISGAPHLMAYIGAYLVIGLGIIQLLSIIFPRFPIKLRIPVNTKATMEKWLYKATLPTAFVGGFIVGLCTFPCSGGIYVAIIGMLAVSQSYLQGLGWMVWYNLIFIAPLLILLFMAANPKTTEKLQKWERHESKNAKILIGLTMIALGAIILIFFV